MVELDSHTYQRKHKIVNYFQNRAQEILHEATQKYGEEQYKKVARYLNKGIQKARDSITSTIEKKSRKQNWDGEILLKNVLAIDYSCDVVMLDYRNQVWPYSTISFARRIGERWEDFVKLCFEYSLKELEFFVPPVFADVKSRLEEEIYEYIEQLNIPRKKKEQLKKYYTKVWRLVDSGAVKLELDLHFEQGGRKYNVDFKSGFGSNEKGNVNRLLLVATTYDIIEQEDYECLLLVRAPEDENNNYFQTLKNSGIWDAYTGRETYDEVQKYTGFDLRGWVEEYIEWEEDFSPSTYSYLNEEDLTKYLRW